MPSLNIGEALVKAAELLDRQGLPSPRLDAEVLLGFVLGKSRTELYINNRDEIADGQLAEYFAAVNRRLLREPVAYITGQKEFMSLSFQVSGSVLVPRPDTELLVEEALALKPSHVLDIGTGSGAIAVALAYYLKESRVWAVDISAEALDIAIANACHHGVGDRISFLSGNLVDPIRVPEYKGFFDLITANLPYIPSCEMDRLDDDVKNFEPWLALEGGDDGLKYYRQMGQGAYEVLRDGGCMLLEIGYNQAAQLQQYLHQLGFRETEVLKDLGGRERVVKALK